MRCAHEVGSKGMRTAMGVCAHTRGGSRVALLFFSTRRRKEYILARRSFIISAGRSFFDPPPILLLSRLLFSLFLFFQTDHPLFRTAPPHRKGVETAGERGEKPQLLCTPEILSQTRYYFSLLSCVHFAVLLLQSCNCARCKVD